MIWDYHNSMSPKMLFIDFRKPIFLFTVINLRSFHEVSIHNYDPLIALCLKSRDILKLLFFLRWKKGLRTCKNNFFVAITLQANQIILLEFTAFASKLMNVWRLKIILSNYLSF